MDQTNSHCRTFYNSSCFRKYLYQLAIVIPNFVPIRNVFDPAQYRSHACVKSWKPRIPASLAQADDPNLQRTIPTIHPNHPYQPSISTTHPNHKSQPSILTIRPNHPYQPSIPTIHPNHPPQPFIPTIHPNHTSQPSLSSFSSPGFVVHSSERRQVLPSRLGKRPRLNYIPSETNSKNG